MDKKLFRSYMLLITFAVALVLLLTKIDVLMKGASVALGLLKPFFIGFAIAFVLNIPYTAILSALNRMDKNHKLKKAKNPIALIGAYVLCMGIIVGIFAIIIPELARSINSLISNSDKYMANIQSFLLWLSQFDFSWVAEIDFTQILNSLKAELTTFVNKSLNALSTIFPQLFSMTASVISIVANFFIAVIVSIYLLVSKEDLCRQVKKLTYAFLPRSWADECVEIARLSSQCFTNFVTGQLMEACILGLLCFVGMTIFRFEYAFLISMMVGVSAIIPVVGAFIGTVPGVLLLLFVEPMQAIWFVVFIVVLQQIEGNLIYPKVVGESVGLPALWVLMGIVVGGGVGGVLGMLLGVPVFTIAYKLTSQITHDRLQKKEIDIRKL
ncbi:MAG: AI-2E family transporter [Peptococcaceae bacterium]|nr:AI-2E family transporter [Peptococcaceae bacterium]